MFALGRARIIPPVFGRVHPRFRSPFISVLFVGLVGCLGVFLGRSFVVPIANVAGTLTAFAYGSTCVVLIILRKRRPDEHRPYRVPGGIGTAVFSILSCLLMLFLGLYQPYVDAKGAFPREWAIMLLWLILGVLFWIFAKRYRSQISEAERYRLIQGK
jgi:amino acid transporter